jgi:DNA-binding MarR family transcriptional regulator
MSEAQKPSSGGSAELAAEVWRQMSDLVLDQDRRRQVSEAMGLSFIRIKVLRRVAKLPLTLRELSAKLGIDPPYATVVVQDLAERGLVERVPHPTDRRAKLVTVTPAGRQAAARAEAILRKPPAGLLALPAARLQELARTLSEIHPVSDD